MQEDTRRWCEQCHKIAFSKREAFQALADAKRAQHVRHLKVIPKRSYPCPHDRTIYHLTHLADRTKIKPGSRAD